MILSWDENKRQKVLLERGLDLADVAVIFESSHFTDQDLRVEYGEDRFVTTGYFKLRLCVVVWTPRGEFHHIISLRKANEREKASFERRMVGP